jgi:hypothetical protein
MRYISHKVQGFHPSKQEFGNAAPLIAGNLAVVEELNYTDQRSTA